jgi:DNA-binding transcriptional MerR regulator
MCCRACNASPGSAPGDFTDLHENRTRLFSEKPQSRLRRAAVATPSKGRGAATRSARLGVSPVPQTFTISDLAREFDLTTRAIRFYEDKGLLAPERAGSGGLQRVYGARDRTRLALTLRAKRLGLSLSEAKDILDMYDSPRDTLAQLQRFLGVLGAHRAQLEAQLAELQANLAEVYAQEEQARAALVRAQKAPKKPRAR